MRREDHGQSHERSSSYRLFIDSRHPVRPLSTRDLSSQRQYASSDFFAGPFSVPALPPASHISHNRNILAMAAARSSSIDRRLLYRKHPCISRTQHRNCWQSFSQKVPRAEVFRMVCPTPYCVSPTMIDSLRDMMCLSISLTQPRATRATLLATPLAPLALCISPTFHS